MTQAKDHAEQVSTLTLPLNGVYFDQIASGEKREEYRLVNEYWAKRLERRRYDLIALTRGYPKGGGIEGVTRLTRRWNGFVPKTITHAHFGDLPVQVYAIDVSEPARLLLNREVRDV
jgi:hypothetical protein